MFSLSGLFGLPVDFRFLDEYDILKNDGLIISLSVGLSLYYDEINTLCFQFHSGLPSAALCNWGSSLANVALFALLFPVVRFVFFPPQLYSAFLILNSYF